MSETSQWGSIPNTQANRFAQTYVGGFVDVSYGNVLLRSGPNPNHLILQNGDISLNGRLFATRDISLNGNLNIGGNLSVSQFSSNKTITTTNYQLVVAEDLSLNGRLFVSGNVGIGTTNPQSALDVSGAIRASGGLTIGLTNATQITYYEEYVWNFTFVALSGSVASAGSLNQGNTKIIRFGNLVTIAPATSRWVVQNFNNTNPPQSSMTVPVRFRPGLDCFFPVLIIENSYYMGWMYITSGGNLYGPYNANMGSINGGGGTIYNIVFGSHTYYAANSAYS